MPMGIVSEADFSKEIKKIPGQEDPKPIPQIREIEKGRGNKPETPDIIREVIGELAMEKVPARVLAKEYNVSESSVSAYKVGAHSTATYSEPNPLLTKHIDSHREKLISKAKSKLDFALESITPNKLDETNAIGLSTIAKNMSAIVKDLEPPVPEASKNNIQFIFMAPKLKDESSYEVIEVSE